MKVTSYAVARPGSMDRNSSSILSGYDAIVGPHSQTQRTAYTVPASRKANLEALFFRVSRSSNATVAGAVYSFIKIYNATSQAVVLYPTDSAITTGVIYANLIGTGMTVYAGESVQSYTADGSTGGTVYYIVSAKLTEFDA